MKKEIERKFLVLNDTYKRLGDFEHCIQGYIPSTNKPSIRIRIIGNKSFLTIKNDISGITRLEYEYELPNQDAKDLLELFCKKTIIEKNRYKIYYKSTLWEVDEFLGDNKGLIVAEVELSSEEESYDKPIWIGLEVSINKKYYNYNLAHHPYKEWDSIG